METPDHALASRPCTGKSKVDVNSRGPEKQPTPAPLQDHRHHAHEPLQYNQIQQDLPEQQPVHVPQQQSDTKRVIIIDAVAVEESLART